MPDDAAYAPNWWRILLIDLTIGISIIAIGLAGATQWNPICWPIVALGLYYTALVIRRFFTWRRLRQNR